ncbi:pyruvate kinase [Chlamydiota bacterium]
MKRYQKKTKIICTIGPASRKKAIITDLVRKGMDCARLNFSHGSHSDHETAIKYIREVEKECNVPIAVIQDLQGPKIRIGDIKEDLLLQKGQEVIFCTSTTVRSNEIPITYEDFYKDIEIGEKIFISDGLIKVEVIQKKGTRVWGRVLSGGVVSTHKGVNLPETAISQEIVTEKDLEDISFGVRIGVDYIAISFVQRAEDIHRVRKEVLKKGKAIPIIAKIERPEAVSNIDAIIELSDGIMVARGDLGVELSVSEVPLIQKEIIKKCNLAGKPVIIATQMLESMIISPFPTRAEVSDVANAVLDGSSCVMLSGETAIGKYPIKVVELMAKILEKTEETIDYNLVDRKKISSVNFNDADAIAHAAVTVSEDIPNGIIVPFTLSGSTALLLSKYRPKAQIVALTPQLDTYRKMVLYLNVFPVFTENVSSTDQMITVVENVLKKLRLVRKNTKAIMVAGIPLKEKGITNLIKLHTVL